MEDEGDEDDKPRELDYEYDQNKRCEETCQDDDGHRVGRFDDV